MKDNSVSDVGWPSGLGEERMISENNQFRGEILIDAFVCAHAHVHTVLIRNNVYSFYCQVLHLFAVGNIHNTIPLLLPFPHTSPDPLASCTNIQISSGWFSEEKKIKQNMIKQNKTKSHQNIKGNEKQVA